ncbi:armadillo-type protein [Limtongia smithiae]|uniref:armadillo-type protein n=1 Tax=Limtongia smithiae TaxID=1125753 RepID=UPI0034CE24EF
MATTAVTDEVPSPASVIFSNQCLDDMLAAVRATSVDWTAFGMPPEYVALLQLVDGTPCDKACAALDYSPATYAAIFCTLFSSGVPIEVLKYSLVLASDLLLADKAFTKAMNSIPQICAPLGALLDCEVDDAVPLFAAKVIVLLVMATEKPPVPVVQKILDYACKLSVLEDANLKDLAVQAYGAVLSVKCTRTLFWAKITSYGPPLIENLKFGRSSLQLQYYSILVFWLLSFELEPAEELNKTCDIISIVLDIIKTAIKEKIIRVSVSLFYNLVTIAPEQNIPAFLVVGGLPVISGMAQRKWTDTELEDDLTSLSSTLQAAHDSMSTFDEYLSELTSGRLKWSPAHKSVDFWKRNVENFKEDDWKLLKELAKVIATTSDNTVLAVASNDIGQVVQELPEGLKLLTQLGTKTKIMELMTHPDQDVKYQALKATQVFVARAFA